MEWKPKGKDKINSLLEIPLQDNVKIGVFQGSKGQNPELDIVVKYLDPSKSKKVRTPKHIHWVIDLLIKKENHETLTMEFIRYLREIWDRLQPIKSKEEQLNIVNKLSNKKELDKFKDLNNYGEYSVEFITYVIELFVIEEKTEAINCFFPDKSHKARIIS